MFNTSKLKRSKVNARKLIPEFVKNGRSIFLKRVQSFVHIHSQMVLLHLPTVKN